MRAAIPESALRDAPSPTREGGAVRLAAVPYAAGHGATLADLLARVVARLQAEGLAVAGAMQTDTPRADRRCCDMHLRDIATGQAFRISQDLGTGSQGCRLETGALEAAAGLVETAVRSGAVVLVLNKFGKREGEGRGFLGALALAAERGIPTLVGLPDSNAAAWTAFAGGLAETLPADEAAILAWCRTAIAAAR